MMVRPQKRVHLPDLLFLENGTAICRVAIGPQYCLSPETKRTHGYRISVRDHEGAYIPAHVLLFDFVFGDAGIPYFAEDTAPLLLLSHLPSYWRISIRKTYLSHAQRQDMYPGTAL